MKLICSRCLTPQSVIKEIGSMRRLECNHLVTFKPEYIFHSFIEPNVDLPNQDGLKTWVNHYSKALVIPSPTQTIEPYFYNAKKGYTAYPFQQKGIQFISESEFKCLIADEMGLGKTVQALGGIKKFPKELLPALILVKSSTKIQWMVETMNWCGYLCQVINSSSDQLIDGIFDVHIASYDILRRFGKINTVVKKTAWGTEIETEERESPFYEFPFKSVILDEVQSIKGESQRTEEVKRIAKGKNIIALSGTPIKNHAAEYFTILNLLRPDLFPTKEGYLRKWVKVEVVNGFEKWGGLKDPEAFAEFTKDFIVRRTRETVRDEIGLTVTGANRHFYHVDFESPKLKKQYEAEEAKFIREMEKETSKKINSIDLLARLSVMRHLVGLNKIQPTVDFLKEFLEETDRKILVGVHHKDVMEAMYLLTAKYCMENNLALPLSFHSGLSTQERYGIVQKFQETDSRIIFGSILAMGEGVDGLQRVCSDGIIAERQWNPANEEQFESRLVRIGQSLPYVDFNYMVATDTIDEYFTEIVEAKRKFMSETLDGKSYNWEESDLMSALYDAIIAKRGKKKTKRGF